MEISWGIAAAWMGLALIASFISIRYKLSVALVEILVGIAAGNLVALLGRHQVLGLPWRLEANEWIKFLAGFGSILLTFLAGAEIEPSVLRRFLKESLAIGVASFAAPFAGALLFAHYVTGWSWPASLICGIALSTTSVAVVYAVMIETGLNETDFGKLILAACFITDLGTVVALGVCFANYDWSLLIFAVVAVVVLWIAPRFVRWFFARFSTHVSEPGVKMVFFMLFGLGALATLSNSEAVLPAYMVGLALAGIFAHQRDTLRRLRTTVFAFLTPFYFLNAGMKVDAVALWGGLGLIVVLLVVKLATKLVGVWPLTRAFRFGSRESNYTTLLMSTGLTFGTISALFGLTHGTTDADGRFHPYIDQQQYSILVTVVIASAIVPTLIAQKFFRPEIEPAIEMEFSTATPGRPAPDDDGERIGDRPAAPPARIEPLGPGTGPGEPLAN
jgi:Kef-type K+ transport system membrane component KefB